MIFVTVGSVLPFDRLIRAVDEWAASRNRSDVFAQVGRSRYRPRKIAYTSLLVPWEFRRRVVEADLVVAHAGVGTILTALELEKPLLVMPRRAALREHTSDHQVEMAKRFGLECQVSVAYDEAALMQKLDSIDKIQVSCRVRKSTSENLLVAVRGFIREN